MDLLPKELEDIILNYKKDLDATIIPPKSYYEKSLDIINNSCRFFLRIPERLYLLEINVFNYISTHSGPHLILLFFGFLIIEVILIMLFISLLFIGFFTSLLVEIKHAIIRRLYL